MTIFTVGFRSDSRAIKYGDLSLQYNLLFDTNHSYRRSASLKLSDINPQFLVPFFSESSGSSYEKEDAGNGSQFELE